MIEKMCPFLATVWNLSLRAVIGLEMGLSATTSAEDPDRSLALSATELLLRSFYSLFALALKDITIAIGSQCACHYY